MHTYSHHLSLHLPYKTPFYWPILLNFFRIRAIDGVENVSETAYARTIRLEGVRGILEVRCNEQRNAIDANVQSNGEINRDALTQHLQRMFDLDANISTITHHLSKDPSLAPLVKKRPGLRVPGYWDPFETAIRAVAGQHVSRIGARHLNTRLTERAGSIITNNSNGALNREFPTPEQILKADLSNIGMPGARVNTLLAIADAYITDPKLFDRGASVEETVTRLCAIKGVGPWTANYIAIRACHEPDGFPASDAGLLRGIANVLGKRLTAKELTARAEVWRPFRAYAAQHVWTEGEEIDT